MKSATLALLIMTFAQDAKAQDTTWINVDLENLSCGVLAATAMAPDAVTENYHLVVGAAVYGVWIGLADRSPLIERDSILTENNGELLDHPSTVMFAAVQICLDNRSLTAAAALRAVVAAQLAPGAERHIVLPK